jgi:hypothetical protein
MNRFRSMAAISPTNYREEDEEGLKEKVQRVKSAHLNGKSKRFSSTLNVNHLNTISGPIKQSQVAGMGYN